MVFPSPRTCHLMGIGAFALLVFLLGLTSQILNRIKLNHYKSVCLLHLVTGAWCWKYRNTLQDVKLPLKHVHPCEKQAECLDVAVKFASAASHRCTFRSPGSISVLADEMVKADELWQLRVQISPLAVSRYIGGIFFWN